jgi:hypothetical protein
VKIPAAEVASTPTTAELQQLKRVAQAHMRELEDEPFLLFGEHEEGTSSMTVSHDYKEDCIPLDHEIAQKVQPCHTTNPVSALFWIHDTAQPSQNQVRSLSGFMAWFYGETMPQPCLRSLSGFMAWHNHGTSLSVASERELCYQSSV